MPTRVRFYRTTGMDLGRLVGLSAAGVNTINNIITKHVPDTVLFLYLSLVYSSHSGPRSST